MVAVEAGAETLARGRNPEVVAEAAIGNPAVEAGAGAGVVLTLVAALKSPAAAETPARVRTPAKGAVFPAWAEEEALTALSPTEVAAVPAAPAMLVV